MIRVILGFQHISLHSHFFCLIDMQLVSVSCFFLRFFSSSSRQPGPSGGGQEQRQEGQGVHGFVAMEVVRVQ